MPDEPDNLVLRLLREIRGKLDEHDRRFDAVDRRFDAVDKSLELMRYQITQSLGLAMAANLTAQHSWERVGTLEERQKLLDDGLAEVRRKVAEMETRLDR